MECGCAIKCSLVGISGHCHSFLVAGNVIAAFSFDCFLFGENLLKPPLLFPKDQGILVSTREKRKEGRGRQLWNVTSLAAIIFIIIGLLSLSNPTEMNGSAPEVWYYSACISMAGSGPECFLSQDPSKLFTWAQRPRSSRVFRGLTATETIDFYGSETPKYLWWCGPNILLPLCGAI